MTTAQQTRINELNQQIELACDIASRQYDAKQDTTEIDAKVERLMAEFNALLDA